MNEAQTQYNALLASGDLKDMFPGMKGNWEQDGKVFTELWRQNNEIIESIYTDAKNRRKG